MKTDNELIAEFMGAKTHEIKPEYLKFPKCIFGSDVYPKEDLAYDWNWNWLMLVVQRIEQLYSENFPLDFVQKVLSKQEDIIDHHYMDVIALPLASKIEEAHKNVVEFIKWYNENKATP